MNPPDNPLIGFLPPNKTPEGDGYVNIAIKAKPGLHTGTQLSNSALIIFDENASMKTNVWTNVIDNTPPVTGIIKPDQPIRGHIDSLKVVGHRWWLWYKVRKIYRNVASVQLTTLSNHTSLLPGPFYFVIRFFDSWFVQIVFTARLYLYIVQSGVDNLGNTERYLSH